MQTAPPPPRRIARAPVEERVDLLDASLDGDELGAALDDEAGVEAVALVHLERESTEVAQPLLAHLEEGFALALELTRGRDDVAFRRTRSRRRRMVGHRPTTLELEDDETLFGHLADGVRRALARVARSP